MSASWEHVLGLGHQQLQNRMWQGDSFINCGASLSFVARIPGAAWDRWAAGEHAGAAVGQLGRAMGSSENKWVLITSLEK